jgi:hypothetical protein
MTQHVYPSFTRRALPALVERDMTSSFTVTRSKPSGAPVKRPRTPTGVWIDWNPRNPHKYHAGDRDTGPGELRLAWELGGEIQGHSVSYDVIDAQGNKWEVKEPNSSDMVRPGVEGRRAVEAVRQEIEEICRQLRRGFSRIEMSALPAFESETAIKSFDVEEFIQHDIPMIMNGELSQGRIVGRTHKNPVGLLQVMEYVKHMIGDADKCRRRVAWNGTERDIDVGTYVRTARELGISDSDMGVEVCDLFAGTFPHPAFRKPRTFIRDVWLKGVQASTVFSNVTGVVLVSPQQFMIIPHAELDDYLRFLYISKGEPRFEVMS